MHKSTPAVAVSPPVRQHVKEALPWDADAAPIIQDIAALLSEAQ